MKTAQILLLPILLFPAWNAHSQDNFFKIIEQPYTSLFQQTALFPDGSLLLSDRLQEGPTSLRKRGFYLAKIDSFGDLIWSKYYNPVGDNLLFDDIEIGEDGSIYVMGTEIVGGAETLFLMKLDEEGEVLKYRHYPGNWKEVFTYSLDLKNGNIMASGLIFYPSNTKRGFVSIFNTSLDLIWSKQFEPFVAYGASILTNDGGVLITSRNLLIKLDEMGELEWSREIDSNNNFDSFTNILETADGYLFEYNKSSLSHFFLLDKNGILTWQSDEFPASYAFGGFSLLPDGDAIVFYNCPDNTGNTPCQLRVSPLGEVYEQKRLEIFYPLRTSFMSHELDANGNILLFGQVNGGGFSIPDYYSDFLNRFSLNDPIGDCFSWNNFNDTEMNDIELDLSSFSITLTDTKMETEEHFIFPTQSIDYFERDMCSWSGSTKIERIDSLLDCGENWSVTLPFEGLVWADSFPDYTRLLSKPGLYQATVINGLDTLVYEYLLEKSACECEVFLPNVFSPNGDGQNEELQIFSNCTFIELQMDIYNRWGGLVFRSNQPGEFWDGTLNGDPVHSDIYVVRIRYQLEDELGVIREGMKVQDLAVVR